MINKKIEDRKLDSIKVTYGNNSHIPIKGFNKEGNLIFGFTINLFKEFCFGDEEQNEKKWEISWGSIGARPVGEVKDYIKILNKAIQVAEKENK